MKPIKTLVFGVSVLAIGIGALSIAPPALADSSVMSAYVKAVDLQFQGTAAVVHVKNISGDKLASKVKLQAMENALGFTVDGMVQCAQDDAVHYSTAKVYFGPVANNDGTITDSTALDNEIFAPETQVWAHYNLSKDHWIVENAEPSLYEVRLSDIKNGHPALRVDPIAEIEKAAEIFVNNGGTLADFYKQDRDIVLQRPISLAGWCQKNGQKKGGYTTKNHTIQIKYEGDPAVYQVALNAQLANNTPNQVQQNQNTPFKLESAEFMANIPHHNGKCPPDQNPKIRINLQTSGAKQGEMELRVKQIHNQYAPYGNYFEAQGIARPAGDTSSLDFSFPLKDILSQDKYSYMLQQPGEMVQHGMQIEMRYRNFDHSNEWSAWKEYDQATFKHTCTPQTTVPLGGMGKTFNNGSGGTSPKMGKIQPQTTPDPKSIDTIQAQPVKPSRAKISN